MIRNLNILVKNISKASSRYDIEKNLALYCGEDWKEHIQYGKQFEFLLLNQPKLLLNGLNNGQKSLFTKSTLIKILPEDSDYVGYYEYYYISSGKIKNVQEVYGNVIEMPEGSYLISEKQINFLSLML